MSLAKTQEPQSAHLGRSACGWTGKEPVAQDCQMGLARASHFWQFPFSTISVFDPGPQPTAHVGYRYTYFVRSTDTDTSHRYGVDTGPGANTRSQHTAVIATSQQLLSRAVGKERRRAIMRRRVLIMTPAYSVTCAGSCLPSPKCSEHRYREDTYMYVVDTQLGGKGVRERAFRSP